jgi:hypothetical protein
MYTPEQSLGKIKPILISALEKLNYGFTIQELEVKFLAELREKLNYSEIKVFPVKLRTLDSQIFTLRFNQSDILNLHNFPESNFIDVRATEQLVEMTVTVGENSLYTKVWENENKQTFNFDKIEQRTNDNQLMPQETAYKPKPKNKYGINVPLEIPKVVSEIRSLLLDLSKELTGPFTVKSIAQRLDEQFSEHTFYSFTELNMALISLSGVHFVLGIHQLEEFKNFPNKYPILKLNINVTDIQLDLNVIYGKYETFFVIANQSAIPDSMDRIEKIKKAMEVMNLIAIDALLLNHVLYQNMTKQKFIASLKNVFDQFKSLGNTKLISYPGMCGSCDTSLGGYVFIGNKTGHHFGLIFDIENFGIRNMQECSNFLAADEKLILNKRIRLEDYDDHDFEELMRIYAMSLT